jgi:hypothetical protein
MKLLSISSVFRHHAHGIDSYEVGKVLGQGGNEGISVKVLLRFCISTAVDLAFDLGRFVYIAGALDDSFTRIYR